MKKLILIIFFVGMVTPWNVFSQGHVYQGPDDGAGDPYLRREGFMRGNRVQLLFKNTTELGGWPRKDAARWPKGVGGNIMHSGLALTVVSQVFLEQDTIPVTDESRIQLLGAQGLLDTLYYCQTSYREQMDKDSTGQIEWGLHPAAGYMNTASETPAMSNDPDSWPQLGWPYLERQLHWSGEWDGRFGRGQIRADLECYFVANDAQDLEYLGRDDRVKYYPRPGMRIGDIDPAVTVQKGEPWGGLGIRVKQRGFQWNNPMAQDVIFWEYTIANISDYDLPRVGFGYWMDNNIGDCCDPNRVSYDKIENLVYSWDITGIGAEGYPTGTMGFAFLESPGMRDDMIDNDDDGLVDEERENDAGSIIGPREGIQNLEKFLYFYGKKESDLKEHWSGDEDQDWNDGEDLNGNGRYDYNEYAGDDIGLDGVAPGELNYTGPDEDGTECNHKPDIGNGYAEPNFGWTDVSETDMLGLTTLSFWNIPPATEPYTHWFRNDKSMWEAMTEDTLTTSSDEQTFHFSTSIFSLASGKTEFISIAELHSFDELSGLNSEEHTAPALFKLKKTVQVIYEKDYQFAKPPKMPTLKAVAGDGYVQLLWDNSADTKTREPFLGNINDFEGYKIYRSTDKDMLDPMKITDGYGTPTFNKPIFQCDLVDGKKDFTDFGLLNGTGYYLGDDTGLAYSFRDEDVQNGRTYYYAIVAYDYGIHPDSLKGTSSIVQSGDRYGIAPSENSVVIRKNEFEEVEFIGQNVAIVTPGTAAAGSFTESDIHVTEGPANLGTGSIVPEVVVPHLVKNDHTYVVKFTTSIIDTIRFHQGHGVLYSTNGLKVYDVTGGGKNLVFEDVTVPGENGVLTPKNFNTILTRETPLDDEYDFYHIAAAEEKSTEIFDGIRLNVKMACRTAKLDSANTGWMPGNSFLNLMVGEEFSTYYPWDYNIVFYDHPVYTGVLGRKTAIKDAEGNKVDKKSILIHQEFNFRVENISFPNSSGAPVLMDMVVQDLNGNNQFDILADRILVGEVTTKGRWAGTIFSIDFTWLADESELPKNKDVYAVRFDRPFWETDSLTFSIRTEEKTDAEKTKSAMENIKVVPNPYVTTNLMEPSVVNKYLNQKRRLMFTNLPEKCTLKIFTISGVLVRELALPQDGLVNYTVTNKSTGESQDLGQHNNGMIHWDMLTRDGLEIAAGMYLYYVKDDMTGAEKIGKFGVIK